MVIQAASNPQAPGVFAVGHHTPDETARLRGRVAALEAAMYRADDILHDLVNFNVDDAVSTAEDARRVMRDALEAA